MDKRPIGVFDSGIGGLTVVTSLINELPKEKIYYVGDTARVPYGNKSPKSIRQYSDEIVSWLVRQNCKIIIIACNTVSSVAIEFLKKKYSVPIIGVIDPVVKYALEITKNKVVGVIGTTATIKSDAYGNKLRLVNKKITIVNIPCPLFVPLVEEGWTSGTVPKSIAKVYLKGLEKVNPDTIILGCTHYPLLKGVIKQVLSNDIQMIDSGFVTSKETKCTLVKHSLESNQSQQELQIFVTDSPELFRESASSFLGDIKIKVKRIELSSD